MVLGVIGAGNMAKAMIAGITKSGSLNGEEIIVSNHNLAKAQELSNQYGVKIDENISVIKNSQVVLLAVSNKDILISPEKAKEVVESMQSEDKTILTYDNKKYDVKHILTEEKSTKIINDIALWIKEKLK